jgi:hypothetical protein
MTSQQQEFHLQQPGCHGAAQQSLHLPSPAATTKTDLGKPQREFCRRRLRHPHLTSKLMGKVPMHNTVVVKPTSATVS